MLSKVPGKARSVCLLGLGLLCVFLATREAVCADEGSKKRGSNNSRVREEVASLIREMTCDFYQKAKVRWAADLRSSPQPEADGYIYGYWKGKFDVEFPKIRLSVEPVLKFSRAVGLGESWDPELRLNQAYIELDSGVGSLKAGWQKFNWGKLDKIEMLDFVNPYDMRWFYTFEKEERKEGILAITYESPKESDVYIEGMFVPRFKPNRRNYFNSDWAVFGRIKELFGGYNWVQDIEVIRPEEYDENNLENSELGIKVGAGLKGWDIGFYLFYGYNRTPALEGGRKVMEFLFSPSSSTLATLSLTSPAERKVKEVYRRDLTVGLDWEGVVGEWGVRGEVIFVKDLPLLSSEYEVVRRNVLGLGLGIDHTFPDDTYVNLQLIVQGINDYPGLYGLERYSFVEVLNFQRQFWEGDLLLDVDFVIRQPYWDWLFNPEVELRLNEHFKLGIGMYSFNGSVDSLFGAKKDRDLVYLELQAYF